MSNALPHEIAAEFFRRLLHYEPETGKFTWRVSLGAAKAGSNAGSISSYGYRRVKIAGKEYFLHRLAWLLAYGRWPENQIDHINGNRSDNRLVNLRDVSQGANALNRREARLGNASGLLGACFHKASSRWFSKIRVNGKPRYLGYFDTPEQAHAAYVAAKRELHSTCSI